MKRLNVRCCCDPGKILGTLPWDESFGPVVFFEMTNGSEFQIEISTVNHWLTLVPEGITDEQLAKTITDANITTPRVSELAYKNPDAPIERLRMIPQFKEGDRI